MIKSVLAACFALSSLAATAAPISVIVGDADGFGGAFPNLDIPQDQRSPAEAAATNGAQQTDFYSVLFNPLPESFTMTFNFGAPVASLALDYRSYGLQAAGLGVFGASANGIDVSALFNFEDGAFTDATHSGAFSSAVLDAINAAGNTLTLTLTRGASLDAAAFDFFRVTGETAAVPEPTSLLLTGLALAGLGAARRRRAA